MIDYKVLKYDDSFVYLLREEHLTKLPRDLFHFSLALGDNVYVVEDGDTKLVLSHQQLHQLDGKSDTSDLFKPLNELLEQFKTLLINRHQHLANLDALFLRFVLSLLMVWQLVGILLVEFLLIAVAIVRLVWSFLSRAFQSLHLLENSRKYLAYWHKQQGKKKQLSDGKND